MILALFIGAAMNTRDSSSKSPIHESGPGAPEAGGLPPSRDTSVRDTVENHQEVEENAALLERAQRGDLEAYGVLVKKFQTRVLTVAYGILRNREDAEDVVQDAFLKAYKNLSSFRGQSSFYTWLYRIVFNLSIDLSRKKYRRTETLSGDALGMDPHIQKDQGRNGEVLLTRLGSPEEEFSRGELRTKINQAMEGLSDDHRAVIMLREVDGLSYSEIAEVVGCTKGTVMSRLHHARKRLQKVLADFAPVLRRGNSSEDENMENHQDSSDSLMESQGREETNSEDKRQMARNVEAYAKSGR